MKKSFVLTLAALALAGSMTLTSCASKSDKACDEICALLEDATKAAKDGDASKAKELSTEIEKLHEEYKDVEFNDEQKDKIKKATAEFASTMMSQAIQNPEMFQE